MPDLTLTAVAAWVREIDPDLADHAARLITDLEEEPVVEEIMKEFGTGLDRARARHAGRLAKALSRDPERDRLRTILAQVGPPRRLRLLGWFAEVTTGDERLIHALTAPEATGAGEAVHHTLLALHRQQILQRLVQHDRIEALLAACEHHQGEYAL